MIVALAPQDGIDLFWNQAEPLLAKAVAYSSGRYETDDLYWGLTSGKMQLWLASEDGSILAAIVTCVNDYPNRPMLTMLFCGGSRSDEWLGSFIDKAKRFALYNKIDCIDLNGRLGWSKKLEKFGFKKKPHVTLELDLL